MQLVLFYVFAAVLLFAATMVITSKNPVHSAMFLVLSFFNAAALWILVEAEFLGVILVLVYVGAVMVLFLFVVMMLDLNTEKLREGFAKYLPLGVVVALVMVLEMVLVVGSESIAPQLADAAAPASDKSNVQQLGGLLYTVYVYPFELAAMVLLLAMIAAITLTLRRRPGAKHQNPGKQVKVRKSDRLRIVKMEAEARTASLRDQQAGKES